MIRKIGDVVTVEAGCSIRTEEAIQETVTQAFLACKQFAVISEKEFPRAEAVITYMGYEVVAHEEDEIKFRWKE